MYSGDGGAVIAREARERAGVLGVGEADGFRPAARLLARLEVRGGVAIVGVLLLLNPTLVVSRRECILGVVFGQPALRCHVVPRAVALV